MWFKDNDYNDDHFDLSQRHLLVGKTLAKMGEHSEVGAASSAQQREGVEVSIQVLGYALFQKWEAVAEICDGAADVKVAQSCVDLVKGYAASLSDDDRYCTLLWLCFITMKCFSLFYLSFIWQEDCVFSPCQL